MQLSSTKYRASLPTHLQNYVLNGPTLSAYRDKRLKEVSGASVRKELYLISAIIYHIPYKGAW